MRQVHERKEIDLIWGGLFDRWQESAETIVLERVRAEGSGTSLYQCIREALLEVAALERAACKR